MKKSRTVRPTAGVESPTTRRLALVELLIDTEAELFDLAVRSGLQVLDAMLEEDRTAICGPRYAHQADGTASRAGTVASTVVLGVCQPPTDPRRARETVAAAAGRVAGTAQRASLRDRQDAPRPSARASQHLETAARPGLRRQSRVAHAAPDGRRHAAEPPGPRVGAGGGADRPPERVLGTYMALLDPRAP